MPTIDEEPLSDGAGGVVLGLTTLARTSETLAIDSWTVRLYAGRAFAMAFGSTSADPRRVVEEGVNITEHALDLLCYRRGATYAVADPYDEHIAWWPTPDGIRVFVSTLLPVQVTLSVTAEVRDAQGRLVPSAPRPERWDESLRYFRLSQLATNVRDCYRSVWLAAESLLDVLLPHTSPGGESEWVKAALGAAASAGIDIAHAMPARAKKGAPADAAYRYFYDSRRNVLFHAKRSRGPLSLRTEADHRELEQALEALSWLYAELGRHITGEHRAIGGMTYAGFDSLGDRTEDAGATLLLLPDLPHVEDTASTLAERAVATGVAYAPPLLRQPGLVAYSANDLRPTGSFVGVSVIVGETRLLDAQILGVLDATDVARLDLRLRHRLSNAQTHDRFAY